MTAVEICLRYELILFLQHLARAEEDLLFDYLEVFTFLEDSWHQLTLNKINSESSTDLDCLRYVLHCLSLGDARPKHKLIELIVVAEHAVDWMIDVLVVLTDILENFYLVMRLCQSKLSLKLHFHSINVVE